MTKQTAIPHTVKMLCPNGQERSTTMYSAPGEAANSEALELAAMLGRQHKGEYRVLRVIPHSEAN